ncbi:hypothetical protein CVS40_9561 [Lucilia cuprina]|nr:hypothetical protein CVS40_9561 [Lucilia cuprina]
MKWTKGERKASEQGCVMGSSRILRLVSKAKQHGVESGDPPQARDSEVCCVAYLRCQESHEPNQKSYIIEHGDQGTHARCVGGNEYDTVAETAAIWTCNRRSIISPFSQSSPSSQLRPPPKTDYTYSEIILHIERDCSPVIVAMPTCPASPLENHHERIIYMIQRNPAPK